MTKTITHFASKLLLAVSMLLPCSAIAAEFEPFALVKVSSVNTLVSVAEKFAAMAEVDDPNFSNIISIVKDTKGVDLNGTIGIGAVSDGAGGIVSFAVLPVTELWGIEVPGFPVLEQIQPFLVKREGGRTDINLSIGTYVALQKQGYLTVVPESLADQAPEDAQKLFADLEKFTFGFKIDLEKVDFETIEKTVFTPWMMIAAMQNPQAGESIENMVEVYRELYKELGSVTSGWVINPQTADIELPITYVARKDSNLAKVIAGYKQEPTVFAGFRGMPETTVFSFSASASSSTAGNAFSDELTKISMEQNRAIFDGMIEQITSEDESGENAALAKKVFDLFMKAQDAEIKKGKNDCALSFSTDATLMAASTTASLNEFKEIANLLEGQARKMISDEVKTLIDGNLKRNYVTVEGFQVSSLSLPIIETIEKATEQPAPKTMPQEMKNLVLSLFWASKDGDESAIALAMGLDFAKTESAFKSALEKTRTPVPVQKPMGIVSVQGIGTLLNQVIHPFLEASASIGGDRNAMIAKQLKQFADVFAAAGSDAVLTLDLDMKADREEMVGRISGKAIQAVISAVKAAQ